MNDPWLLYHLGVLTLLVVSLAMAVLNLFFFSSLRPAHPPADTPLVSVLVPARNEERRLHGCVASLKAQDYPRIEIIVLNDNSEDGTERVLREAGFAEENPHLRLIQGAPLPPGWTGKCWACDQLASMARGDYLLFTDADTFHRANAVTAAVHHAVETDSDLLSGWPRLVTRSWSEKLVIPMIHLLAGALYPHALATLVQRYPNSARRVSPRLLRILGAANGQFLLFKRTSYERIGGHAAVRSHMVEDVALGREVMARSSQGMRLVNCDASTLIDCRMYENFGEVWEGFTKNVRPAFENAPLAFLLTGVVQLCCFFLPCVLIFLPLKWWTLVAAQVALVYLIRLILTVRFRTSWLSLIFHPAAHAIAMLIALNSWRRSAGAGVSWKGRTYRLKPE